MWLAVWEHNRRAQVFYRKHGFRRVGTQGFRLGAATQTDEVLLRPLSFDVSLAIVAGGGATRLGGVCKPLLRVSGRPVLERLLALRTLAEEVLLVSADPRLPDAGVRRVTDLLPGRGAPGGVHAALAQTRSPWVLAVAGTCRSWTAGRCSRCSRRAPTTSTRWPTPSPAGSSRSPRCTAARSRPRFAEALAGGGESFRALWARLRGRTLPESVLREATGDVRAVLSLNLPSDVTTWVDTPPDPRS